MKKFELVPITPEFIDIIILLSRWFHGNNDKVVAWLNTANINLDGDSPNQMLNTFREKQLLRFIRDTMPYGI